jgi:hypothetical protein
MASFTKGGSFVSTPFGKNNFLRSTRDLKVESYDARVRDHPVEDRRRLAEPEDPPARHRSGQDHLRRGLGQGRAVLRRAADGRQTLANIVGINRTFLPWQTIERDVEVGVVYECVAVQGWCIELDASGQPDRPDGHDGCRHDRQEEPGHQVPLSPTATSSNENEGFTET